MNKTGYQIQKEKAEALEKKLAAMYEVLDDYENALKKIVFLKGPECLKAPEIAKEALLK